MQMLSPIWKGRKSRRLKSQVTVYLTIERLDTEAQPRTNPTQQTVDLMGVPVSYYTLNISTIFSENLTLVSEAC
jgi:hypothetical protein